MGIRKRWILIGSSLLLITLLFSGCAAREAAQPEASPTSTLEAAALVEMSFSVKKSSEGGCMPYFTPPASLPTPSYPPLVTTDPNTLSKRRQALLSLEQQIVDVGGHTTEQGAVLTKDWLELLMQPAKEQPTLTDEEVEGLLEVVFYSACLDSFVCPQEATGTNLSRISQLYYHDMERIIGSKPITPDMLPAFQCEYPISGIRQWDINTYEEGYKGYAQEMYIHYNTLNALAEQIFGTGFSQSQEQLEKSMRSENYQKGFFIYCIGDGTVDFIVHAYTYLDDNLYYVQIRDDAWDDEPDAMRLIVEKNENAKWGFYVKSILRPKYLDENCIIEVDQYTKFLRRGNPEITRGN